jgi:DNA polymerase-3 subunit delta'
MSGRLAPWLATQLQSLLRQNGHALVLQGPSGLGQYELGLELVRAWLCEEPAGEGACGKCASCHGFEVRTHADLAVLMPETVMLELGWPLPEKAQKDIDDKKRKPSKEIRIDAVRDAIEFAQRTSARGRGKAVLLYPADRMNTPTANALLKTLEEPPGGTRFVLATDAAHQLLPTVRSRCLSHAMHWPSAQEAVGWLVAEGVAEPDARVLLRAAGGRPQQALAMAREGRTARSWAALPKAVARGDVSALADCTPGQAIDALQKVCHDLLAVGNGAAPRFFDAADLPRGPSAQALGVWWKELAQELRTAEHPFNAPLALEALVSRARSALHSPAP